MAAIRRGVVKASLIENDGIKSVAAKKTGLTRNTFRSYQEQAELNS